MAAEVNGKNTFKLFQPFKPFQSIADENSKSEKLSEERENEIKS